MAISGGGGGNVRAITPSGDVTGTADTAAILQAVAAGANILLAAGDFYWKALLRIMVNRVSITGAGMGRTTIHDLLPAATTAGANALIALGYNYLAQLQAGIGVPAPIYVDEVMLRDFTIQPTAATTRNLVTAGIIAVLGATNFEIARVEITGGDGMGMSVSGDGNSSGVIQDCNIHDTCADGIQVNGGNRVRIIDNHVSNSGDDSISLVQVNYASLGYVIPGGYDVAVHDCLVTDNQIDNAGAAGVAVNGGSSLRILDNEINLTWGAGVRVDSIWQGGVTYGATSAIRVAGNTIKNAGQSTNPGDRALTDAATPYGYVAGVKVTTIPYSGAAAGGTIADIVIEDNDIQAPCFNYCIVDGAGISGVTWRHNRCSGVIATAPATARGVDGRVPVGAAAAGTQTFALGAGIHCVTGAGLRAVGNQIQTAVGIGVNFTAGTSGHHRLEGNDTTGLPAAAVVAAYTLSAGTVVAIGNNAVSATLTAAITTTGATVAVSANNAFQVA